MKRDDIEEFKIIILVFFAFPICYIFCLCNGVNAKESIMIAFVWTVVVWFITIITIIVSCKIKRPKYIYEFSKKLDIEQIFVIIKLMRLEEYYVALNGCILEPETLLDNLNIKYLSRDNEIFLRVNENELMKLF